MFAFISTACHRVLGGHPPSLFSCQCVRIMCSGVGSCVCVCLRARVLCSALPFGPRPRVCQLSMQHRYASIPFQKFYAQVHTSKCDMEIAHAPTHIRMYTRAHTQPAQKLLHFLGQRNAHPLFVYDHVYPIACTQSNSIAGSSRVSPAGRMFCQHPSHPAWPHSCYLAYYQTRLSSAAPQPPTPTSTTHKSW